MAAVIEHTELAARFFRGFAGTGTLRLIAAFAAPFGAALLLRLTVTAGGYFTAGALPRLGRYGSLRPVRGTALDRLLGVCAFLRIVLPVGGKGAVLSHGAPTIAF